MQQTFLKEFDDNTNNLLSAIEQIADADFNRIPFEGSWTAARVVDHVCRAERWIGKALGGKAETTERAADQKIEGLKSIFLDFSKKLKSPDFIFPPDEILQKPDLIERLKAGRQKIKAEAAVQNLNDTHPDAPLPAFGELTGIEWMSFVIFHSKRHIHQLNKIAVALHNSANG